MALETLAAAPVSAIAQRRAVVALVTLSLAAFTFVTTEILPMGLLTVIAPDVHRPTAQVGLLVTGYAVVVLLASLPLTRLTRNVPRRHLLAITLAAFTATTLLSAIARSYEVLLVSRLLTGLTQAIFWSVVFSTAMGMFPPEIRGRIVARLGVGSALAPVLGVPFATWIGQQAGWRVAFAVVSVLGIVLAAVVAVTVPTIAPAANPAARGTAPDRLRFGLLLAAIIVAVTGTMTVFTYVTPYLLSVSGFAAGSLSVLLLTQGSAGVVGTVTAGRYLDRYPTGVLVSAVALITVAMLSLYAFGTVQALAVGLLAVSGLAFSTMVAAIQHRTMQVAPGSTDTAAAAASSAFNVGIAAGSLLGSLLITHLGVRVVSLAGGLLLAAALTIVVAEPWLSSHAARPRQPRPEVAVPCAG